MSTSIAAIYRENVRSKTSGASAKPALLGPMSSDCGDTLTHTLVAEPYSSVHVRMGALHAVLYSVNRVMCWRLAADGTRCDVGRGRETHRHHYTRLPASLGDEVGGLSTSLGLFASPSLILSTESVVVMEWKGMSTSIATQYRFEARRRAQAQNRHCLGP